MSNYVQSTNFATKDALPSGDPLKIVRGTEINTEFNNIATAVATKADLLSPTFTGLPLAPTASPSTNNTQLATTAFSAAAITAERTATATLTNKTISGGTIAGITDLAIADGGTGASTAADAFLALKQNASTSVTGVVQLATNVEAAAGTDALKSITPSSLRDGLNATGSAPVFAARAWVNFDGTGTVAIRASGNVSSITDNGVGDYTLNFSTAMPNTNYCVVGSTDGDTNQGNPLILAKNTATALTTTAARIIMKRAATAGTADREDIFASIFR